MHPAISYQLAQARAADLRRLGQRDTIACGLGQPGQPGRPGLTAWVPHRIGAVPDPVQRGQRDIPAY